MTRPPRLNYNLNEGPAVWERVLAERRPFRTAAGGTGCPVRQPPQLPADDGYWYSYFGHLPRQEAAGLADADYLVYSYQTLIGWHSRTLGWQVPQISYSQGTSRLQNILRDAAQATEEAAAQAAGGE